MSSIDNFEELYGVTEERAINFWVTNLQEVVGGERWSRIRDSTGVYLASVLGHFCLEPIDRVKALSSDYAPSDLEFRQFADLTQIAEMMMGQLTTARSPFWMESAGAHILLYAGFFHNQNRERHNIDFFSRLGKDCYLMAAVGKRTKVMRSMAKEFDQYLFYLARLHRHLWEKRYLITPEN